MITNIAASDLLCLLEGSAMASKFLAVLLLAFPTQWVAPLARRMGMRIHPTARIGFSWVATEDLRMGKEARIGHFNAIRVRRVAMRSHASVGSFNWLNGAFSVLLREHAEVGARNVITRALVASEIGAAALRIGRWSKVTSSHKLEVMRSITFGTHTILAGSGSQIWTHGYVHARAGRFRVDGNIIIGDHVYLGSRCILNPGVRIGDDISIGSGCCVSKDLLKPGLYVSAPLRHIERNNDAPGQELVGANGANLTEPVYRKAKPTLTAAK